MHHVFVRIWTSSGNHLFSGQRAFVQSYFFRRKKGGRKSEFLFQKVAFWKGNGQVKGLRDFVTALVPSNCWSEVRDEVTESKSSVSLWSRLAD